MLGEKCQDQYKQLSVKAWLKFKKHNEHFF